MARMDEIKILCDRLAPLGWRSLLQSATGNELDISQATDGELKGELLKSLPIINRVLPGFEDFATDGASAVTPAQPAFSLLYHALASPLVTHDHAGRPLQGFPTPAELDQLETLYLVCHPCLSHNSYRKTVVSQSLRAAVFSTEYRPVTLSRALI